MVVGRVIIDSESTSAHFALNETSLVLESSCMMGFGARVPLRFGVEVSPLIFSPSELDQLHEVYLPGESFDCAY